MRLLSKSKLLSYRQCPKRLWLEVNRRDLNVDPRGGVQFSAGASVGEVARQVFDPQGVGITLNIESLGIEQSLLRSAELVRSPAPLFEAGFTGGGATAFADVLLPLDNGDGLAWRMIEIKSSSEVKDYHRDDAAVQAYIVRQTKLPLESISVATVDAGWIYPGGRNYEGLLVETDLTAETKEREAEVECWIADAEAILASREEPIRPTGAHCSDPFDCGFITYCQSQEPPVEYPVSWLPNIRTQALKAHIVDHQVREIVDVPDMLLNTTQQRVKACTLSGEGFFDAMGASQALAGHGFPAYFLDFETMSFAVPIWAGTRPYQSIPFQFSVHRVSELGDAEHREFLDLSGEDARRALAEALLDACGTEGPIYVYSSFELSRIRDLIQDFRDLAGRLSGLVDRLVDLRPIAQTYYYHPSQQGSWSIKKVLPAITGRGYEELAGIRDGGMAMEAYLEAINPETTPERKAEIDRQLREYCALDTRAMIQVWSFFLGL